MASFVLSTHQGACNNACMKNVQIRDVPDTIHAILTERAASENKSLQVFLTELLAHEARKSASAATLLRIARETSSSAAIPRQEILDVIRADRASH